ncbi:pseudouridine synthase [Roseivirga pacifica]|uniref:Pseudouridine synthase n=1 Tax=Roseivirga pacifica TaxID=1267423 RepID=A0A1I0N2Q3_9BACT|nr:pseudouridine synthase [Roseivirga pacifica]MCO6359411.1 pseudouridine synthase [Roseivirga pacifica]MCO6366781.1 pseudouridine synthase [Roseivirga pacifica]MCO6370687.1 pseudouridine synthase [Roseivirga pacifica]MCO6374437.1 pseudouridine synthase [Roseivirga pacifica]MCO6379696.1 pseudouridine synthase [Roseivirga pacifica]
MQRKQNSKKKFGTNKPQNTPESSPQKSAGFDEPVRLNRYIANSGVCSRREADKLIEAGEIKVDGEVIKEMGYKVQPGQVVKYNGKALNPETLQYILLNKPKGFITTTSDPKGRRTVMDLVKNACPEQIFPVGRLDRATTGLLLFTNDGDLARKLTHPSKQILKVYQVTLDQPITQADFDEIVNGVKLEDGLVEVNDLAIVSSDKKNIGIEIHIGKNRIVRRLFEHFGYKVEKLDRVVFAGLTKKDLPRGKWRTLTDKELRGLK